MSRLGGWLRPSKKADSPAVSVSDEDFSSKQRKDLEDAMRWAELIMNDDIDGAWAGLQDGDSSFHELGAAVVFFMRSILGFEKQVMAEATQKLNDCETRATTDIKAAQRHPTSKLYPAGTEYELVRAQTHLMGAVVGVLHENLIEAMKSFYKLRRAYMALDAIITTEAKAQAQGSRIGTPVSILSFTGGSSQVSESGDRSNKGSKAPSIVVDADNDDSGDEFVDAKEVISEQPTPDASQPPTIITTPDPESQLSQVMSKTKINESSSSLRSSVPDAEALDLELIGNPVDVFIHSGSNMCFGILLLLLTLVPPTFNRILSVVGFHGDRARGVRMLWRSVTFPNINGAVSGMVLLIYYFGLLGLVDILPDDKDYDEDAEIVGPPREKCRTLLAEMRRRYPDSSLWQLEESRQQASLRRLDLAIDILVKSKEAKMKQVAALIKFELALDALFIQNWLLMRDTFIACIDINDWSPSMYEYNAGCASLELYRDAVANGDKAEAEKQKKAAEESLRKAPTLAGKKRLMAKQLPIETLVQHKLSKWEERAKRLKVDLADAIGTSPAMEMCYLWNGSKRMGTAELERGLKNLDWDRCAAAGEAAVAAMKAEKDEMGVWALSRAALLRNMGRLDEAKALLDEHVFAHDRSTFKGPTKDDYVMPAGTYELGVMAWQQCCDPPADLEGDDAIADFRKRKLEECEGHLETCRGWEAYSMDTRIGLRVQSGLETLEWFRRKMG